MELDFRHVLRAFGRFWWLLVLGSLLMAILAYGVSLYQTPMYRAQVTLQVNPVQTSNGLDYNALLYAERLTQTFQRLVTVRPVLEPVIEELALPYTAEQLAGNVTVQAESDSQLLIIQVSDPDPDRASTTANALATSFATFVADQQAVTADSADVPDAQILVRESSIRPSAPYTPRTTLNVAVGMFTGLVLAAGVVLFIVYLDDTVRSAIDLSRLNAGPLLASVRKFPKPEKGRSHLFVADRPGSDEAEAIRLLRTNIRLASTAQPLGTLAVSSPNASEGTSTIAANLAVAFAQVGLATALVDADVRQPQQHRIFQVENDRGLTTLLTDANKNWLEVALDTGIHDLVIIPSGAVPPGATADLLSLTQLSEILEDLKSAFDVVIIDTPPILPVSDALVVASHTDGIVLVCRSGHTKIEALRRSAETLQRGAVRIVGVVLNQENSQRRTAFHRAKGADEPDEVVAGGAEPTLTLGKLRGWPRLKPSIAVAGDE